MAEVRYLAVTPVTESPRQAREAEGSGTPRRVSVKAPEVRRTPSWSPLPAEHQQASAASRLESPGQGSTSSPEPARGKGNRGNSEQPPENAERGPGW